MLSSVTMLVTYVVLGLPVGAIGIPWVLLTGDIGPLYRWSMRVVRAGVKLARIRVQVEGREHIPAQPSIFMSNHVSNLDPPIMLPFLPFRTAFFIKRSLLKIPLVGYGMRLAGFIPVDRDGRLESARESQRIPRVRARATADCCLSKRGRFISPWSRAHRLFPSLFGVRST
jgi:1-acyl-sn-glycerol-3-phosphate acyltransferase